MELLQPKQEDRAVAAGSGRLRTQQALRTPWARTGTDRL